MVDSAGVSNLDAAATADPLTVALPQIGNLAATIHRLVQAGLAADKVAERLAAFTDPSLVPALKTLETVLAAVEKYLPGTKSGESAAERGGE